MAVASGVAPYAYTGPALNFSAQGQTIAPSAILFEEAMFVLKAEHNRVRGWSSGLTATNRDFTSYDPDFPGFSFKFVNNSGTFIKYVNTGYSGLFDPNPTGGYLDGSLTTHSGTVSGIPNLPGTFYCKDYIMDMREVLVSIVHSIAIDLFPTDTEIGASGILADWLVCYKGYTDGTARSGLFYEESGVVSQFFDDFQSDWRADVKTSGVGASGIFDRHLNEVRYQPMPWISGEGGTIIGLDPPWSGVSTYPLSPIYQRTNGTLATGWNNFTIYGDTLTSGMSLVASGHNGTSIKLITSYVPYNEAFFSYFPRSGIFSPVSLTSGWYKLILTSGNATLFPWGTGIANSSRIAQWPRGSNWVGSGGADALYVSDDIFAIQDHDNTNSSVFNRTNTESGLIWKIPSLFPQSDTLETVDFVPVRPSTSGDAAVWGNDIRSLFGAGGETKLRAGDWVYNRSTDRILRVLSSGGNQEWPLAGIHNTYYAGSGYIVEWHPRNPFLNLESVNEVTTSVDTAGTIKRAQGLETITHDGTDYICNGYYVSDGYVAGNLSGISGAYLKINTSYDLVDAIMYGGSSGTAFRLHYARGTSEYLGVPMDVSSKAGLEDWPGEVSGYYVVTLNWGEMTSPGSASYAVQRYEIGLSSAVSGILNRNGTTIDTTPRIIDWCDKEDSDDLYCIFYAYPTSALSGGDNTIYRWLGKVDDTAHPYTITDAWLVGGDGTRNGLAASIRAASLSTFIDNFKY